MTNIVIILFVLYFGFVQSARYCCTGSYDSSNSLLDGVRQTECLADPADDFCLTVPGTGTTSNLLCGSDTVTAGTRCDTDYCNCPTGFRRTDGNTFGEMKKIMYPIMGMIFGVLWIILAFIGASLPLNIILIVVGLLDAIFGIFLIFVPITTFLGLFYIAIGAFTIAISRHSWGGDRGIDFLLALTIIVFLLTGGLTFVAFDFGGGRDYVNRMAGYVPFCDRDMNIDSVGLSTRCGNYALFVTFCVFLLFLIQPIAMIAAAFKRVGHHHSETTVVVNEKHPKPENKNTV